MQSTRRFYIGLMVSLASFVFLLMLTDPWWAAILCVIGLCVPAYDTGVSHGLEVAADMAADRGHDELSKQLLES